jgi:type I restriction enzyme S subunit
MKLPHIKRYDAYQDSGVEWLGEVPAHWEVKRLKDTIACGLSYGANESAVDSNPKHPRYIRITDFSDDETLKDETFKSLAPDVANAYLLKDGDILFARSGATAGKTFHFKGYKGKACYAGYLIKARLKNSVLSPDFLSLYTKSFVYNDWRNSIVIKATIENISAEKYGFFLFVPTPPLLEQTAIAAYLDTKTAQLDRQIELLGQKAVQYGKLKQSLINETVTRGLDKTVAMKDSGVAWIGEIPAHWEVRRIKEVCDINKRTLSEKTSASYEFDYVDIGGVTYGVKNFVKERMTFDVAPSRAKRVVQKGDTIVSTVRTYLKAIAFIDEEVTDLIVSTGFAVVSPRKVVVNKYCSYLLTSNCMVDEICALSTGVSYPATNATVIGDLFFLLPPIVEQQAIAAYLDTKTAHIDRIITTLNRQIATLKELRNTLINEVVTGKIKVM